MWFMNNWPEKLTVYWENVCVMKKQEQENLQKAARQMQASKGIDMKYHYFGLGEPMGIERQIALDLQGEKLAADIVVSSKFDIFYDQQLLLGNEKLFRPLTGEFPLRQELQKTGIAYPGGYFHPCLVIPVIILGNKKLLGETGPPRSWAELLDDQWAGRVLIGGVDRPVGRAFLIGMWHLFGEEGLRRCVQNCRMASVPAAVMNAVAKDEYPLGVVPLIFSSRDGRENLLDIWPQEGALAIPSYVSIREGSAEEALFFVKENLFSTATQSFYSQRAMGIPVHPDVKAPAIVEENDFNLIFPGWEWIKQMDMRYLNQVCNEIKPV